ncbi:CX domain-containing protein [Aphelenchoides fujianensis]|nr:CX domain-containing protein [Aphelenchoides fujianensis]
MREVVIICILLLTQPLLEARRGGGGGGFSGGRGTSGARMGAGGGMGGGAPVGGGGGFRPNTGGGGFQPGMNQGGGFNNRGNYPHQPQPNYGAGGMHGPGGGFTNGNSFGSPSRASTFKHALAGAAIGTVGGLLAFEAGKAIIQHATSPFHYGNRDYYFDQQNYRGSASGPRCSMPLSQLISVSTPASTTPPPVTDSTLAPGATTTPSPNQLLQNLQFADGTRPKEVVWGCQANEICCGTECCPNPNASPNGASGYSSGARSGSLIALLVILGLLIACCCACVCAYKFCRSSIENLLPSRRNQNNSYYDDGRNHQSSLSDEQLPSRRRSSYPPQQYPSYPSQYPNQNQYGGPGPKF